MFLFFWTSTTTGKSRGVGLQLVQQLDKLDKKTKSDFLDWKQPKRTKRSRQQYQQVIFRGNKLRLSSLEV